MPAFKRSAPHGSVVYPYRRRSQNAATRWAPGFLNPASPGAERELTFRRLGGLRAWQGSVSDRGPRRRMQLSMNSPRQDVVPGFRTGVSCAVSVRWMRPGERFSMALSTSSGPGQARAHGMDESQSLGSRVSLPPVAIEFETSPVMGR